MTSLQVLTLSDSAEWQRILDRCVPYDFYHLPRYHALAETSGEGRARLFVYTEGGCTIALPLLLRDLDGNWAEADWKDATSVYGYAGPVSSQREVPEAVAANFQLALAAKLREFQVVTVFSRLHPFHTQYSLIAGLGDCRWSRTVSIDLTLEPALQRAKYRKAYKEGINKLRRRGLTVVQDRERTYLVDFIRIYEETMRRVDAANRYYFSAAYFQQLLDGLGAPIELFMCLCDGRPICGGLFSACHGIIQYHLGGTLDKALKLSPMKLLVDEVRLWGNQQGMQSLHLGGGMSNAPDDSLLHHKLGFSDRTHDFAVWRWVLAAGPYERLCAAKAEWNERQRLRAADTDFFPVYRAPTVSSELSAPVDQAAVSTVSPTHISEEIRPASWEGAASDESRKPGGPDAPTARQELRPPNTSLAAGAPGVTLPVGQAFQPDGQARKPDLRGASTTGGGAMNILLTCAGRRSHIVRAFKDALGRRGRVLACDSTGAAPALLEADQGFMVPAVDHADYFEVLGGVCRQHEVRLVISVHDLELPGLAQHARRFREWGTIVVISAPEVIATCQDKWASFLFLRANNIPTPDTYKSLADAQEALACGALRYPLVIKPRWGTGSIGVEWVANDHELHLAHEWARLQLKKTFVAKLGQLNGAEPDGSFVFQQALAGQEYGMDIVNDLDGRHVACLCRKKLVMRAGNTDRAVTISEPSLERIGELLGERLGHVGPLDCDLIVAEDNSVVIDMNPRFGGGYPFSHLAGANLPAALIAWANGEESDAAWLQSKPGVLSAKYDGMAIIDQEGTVHEPGAAHERGRSAPKRLPSSTAILPTRSST